MKLIKGCIMKRMKIYSKEWISIQFLSSYKFKIPMTVCFIMYLIGLFIGQGLKIQFLAILGSICIVLSFCFGLLK